MAASFSGLAEHVECHAVVPICSFGTKCEPEHSHRPLRVGMVLVWARPNGSSGTCRDSTFSPDCTRTIESLAGRLHDQVWDQHQLILDPEARADRIHLVKTGAVRVFQISPEGRELTTAILRPGQLLGTAALAGVGVRASFAEALEPQTCVCDATADEFLRMMSAHPLLAAKIMVALARQALRLEQQLEQLAFQEVPVRLAQALVQLAEDNAGELPPNITHESLAKLISSTRETVSKTLGQFAEEGLVELGYRRIRVLDWPKLHRIAGLEPSGGTAS
jgi:CRP/FNR family transcriptional regulator, cyclic AMP receptor protein